MDTTISSRVIGTLFLLAALHPAASASAQVARGTVTERGSGATIPGVLVSLVDEQRRIVSTVFSDEKGGYEVRAPAAGRFAIEAKRIGVRQRRGEFFALAIGENHREDIVLDPVVSVLAGTKVEGRSKCVARPGDNVRTATLWEDARAALTATVLTARRPIAGTVTRFTRDLAPENGRVLSSDHQNVHGDISRPFASIPVAELSRGGYVVQREDGSTDYYAPDAEALLSDEFLADHCFRLVPGGREMVNMVGLGFEPVEGRRVPDIEGVLWMDAATSELEKIEFTYRSIPGPRLRREFGGEVRFTRLPTGRWIVSSWVIRMPVIAVRPGTYEVVPGGLRTEMRESEILKAVREEGGSVLLDRGPPPPREAISGMVLDSTTGGPVAGAKVTIDGTGISAVTGADGRFELLGIPQGLYSIVATTPELDSLGVSGPADTVRLTVRGGPEVTLAIPSRAALAASMCEGPRADARLAVLRVLVVDSTSGVPLRDVDARIWWRGYTGSVGQKNLAEDVDGVVARLDSLGSFTVCNLPPGETLRVESPRGAKIIFSDTLRAATGEVGWRVLRVRTSKP